MPEVLEMTTSGKQGWKAAVTPKLIRDGFLGRLLLSRLSLQKAGREVNRQRENHKGYLRQPQAVSDGPGDTCRQRLPTHQDAKRRGGKTGWHWGYCPQAPEIRIIQQPPLPEAKSAPSKDPG